MNKNRELLKRMGMLKEFDIWKASIPKEPFSIGTKVKFKKVWYRPNVSIGTLGKIVKTNDTFIENVIQVRTIEGQDVGFWGYELREYLEEI